MKKGVKNKAAPWHHDQAYYPINGMQVWLFLSIVEGLIDSHF